MRAKTLEAIKKAIEDRIYVITETDAGFRNISRAIEYKGKYLQVFDADRCRGLSKALVILSGGPESGNDMIDIQIQASRFGGIKFMSLYTKATEMRMNPHWARGRLALERRRKRYSV